MEAACSVLIVSDDDHEGVEAPWEIDGLMEAVLYTPPPNPSGLRSDTRTS